MSGYELTEPNYVMLKEHVIEQLGKLDAGKYGSNKQKISLEKYFDRFKKYIDQAYLGSKFPSDFDEFLVNKYLIMISIYLDQILENEKTKTELEQTVGQHRLFAVLLTLAAKFLLDDHIGNKNMAKIAGLDMEQFNTLEIQVFQVLNSNIFISPEKFEEKQKEIFQKENVLYSGDWVMSQDKHVEPPIPVVENQEKLAAITNAATTNAAEASAVSNAAAGTKKSWGFFSFAKWVQSSVTECLSKKPTAATGGLAQHVQPTDNQEPRSPKKARRPVVEEQEQDPNLIERPGAPSPKQ